MLVIHACHVCAAGCGSVLALLRRKGSSVLFAAVDVD